MRAWDDGPVVVMRTVLIVHDRANQRPWVAVDQKSGLPLLRLRERYQLQGMCARLGWEMISATQFEGRATTPTDRKRAVRRTAKIRW